MHIPNNNPKITSSNKVSHILFDFKTLLWNHLSIGKENTIPRIIHGKDAISKELFLNNSNKFVLLNVKIFFKIIIKSFKFSTLNITQPILIKNKGNYEVISEKVLQI